MDQYGFGVFGNAPAAGVYNMDVSGAGATAGESSDGALAKFVAGSKDFLAFFREAGASVAVVKQQIENPAMVGIGPNGQPITQKPKQSIDPMLIIGGALIWWMAKHA